MKTLLILRHAKSSWQDEQIPDHDRPLNKRGKRDAPRIGERLQQANLQPDLIISSTAKRARKTATHVAKPCGYPGHIELDGTLYLAPPESYLVAIHKIDDQVRCALVVGHNPGLEQLLALLTGHNAHLPTAALAHVQLEIEAWHDVNSQTRGVLIDLWQPDEPE
ncbi:MAG: SixA phosphatase family protein [Pirellulaceae bacterium]